MNGRWGVALILVFVVFVFWAAGIFFLLPILACGLSLWEWMRLSQKTSSPLGLRLLVAFFFCILPAVSFLVLNDAWGLIIVGLVALTDTLAYFVGRQWGRHKLAPQISPKKTWEGFLGGIILSTLAMNSLLGLLTYDFGPSFLGLLLLAFLSQMGDLLESRLKRFLTIKDTGTLLRGHGGVMDRVDGFIFTAPVAALLFNMTDYL